MSGYRLKAIDEMASIHDGIVKLAGAELGVESFGIQVLDFPAGFDHYPEHDHAAEDQEEVYLALRGDGTFTIDGEQVPLEPGALLRIAPASRRKLEPGAEGIRVLAVGCTRAGAYERPDDFTLAVRS